MSVRIDRDVINALIAGHFADPFSVLGMHQTDAGLEVRALSYRKGLLTCENDAFV